MTLPSSGPLSLSQIQGEFGGSNPISLSEYYGASGGVPSSGTISISDFYGKSNILGSLVYVGSYSSIAGSTDGDLIWLTIYTTTSSTGFSYPGTAPALPSGFTNITSGTYYAQASAGEGQYVFNGVNYRMCYATSSSTTRSSATSASGTKTGMVYRCPSGTGSGPLQVVAASAGTISLSGSTYLASIVYAGLQRAASSTTTVPDATVNSATATRQSESVGSNASGPRAVAMDYQVWESNYLPASSVSASSSATENYWFVVRR